MWKKGGAKNFGEFVRKIQSGSNTEAALKAVYNADGKTLGQAYVYSLPSGAAKKGKK